MKRIVLLLLAAALCGGCATRYTITLNNGDMVTSKGKPKFVQARNGYTFKDADGEPSFVSAMRVREIAPASMVAPSKSYNPNSFR